MDSRARTLAKTLSWRLVAVTVTATCVWLVTGEITLAASVGALDTLLKLAGYYLHERAWEQTDFGRAPAPRVSV